MPDYRLEFDEHMATLRSELHEMGYRGMAGVYHIFEAAIREQSPQLAVMALANARMADLRTLGKRRGLRDRTKRGLAWQIVLWRKAGTKEGTR